MACSGVRWTAEERRRRAFPGLCARFFHLLHQVGRPAPTAKAELGHALIARYAERFASSLAAIDENEASAPGRLREYTTLYRNVLEAGRMCLCGMLAAEYQTLPDAMRQAVTKFFDANHVWLTRVLEEGRADGTIQFAGQARDAAELIVGSLEGAMLVARTYGDTSRFKAVSEQLLAEFKRP